MKTSVIVALLLLTLGLAAFAMPVEDNGGMQNDTDVVSYEGDVYDDSAAVEFAAPTYTPARDFTFNYNHVAVSTDTTVKLWRSDRAFAIDYVEYINPTGLAQDASVYYTVKLLNASAVAASWSTVSSTGDGPLLADTFVELAKSATASNLRGAAGVTVSLFLDKTAGPPADGAAAPTNTLPAGRVVVHGHYLQ